MSQSTSFGNTNTQINTVASAAAQTQTTTVTQTTNSPIRETAPAVQPPTPIINPSTTQETLARPSIYNTTTLTNAVFSEETNAQPGVEHPILEPAQPDNTNTDRANHRPRPTHTLLRQGGTRLIQTATPNLHQNEEPALLALNNRRNALIPAEAQALVTAPTNPRPAGRFGESEGLPGLAAAPIRTRSPIPEDRPALTRNQGIHPSLPQRAQAVRQQLFPETAHLAQTQTIDALGFEAGSGIQLSQAEIKDIAQSINLDGFQYTSVREEVSGPVAGSLYFRSNDHGRLFRIRLEHDCGPAIEVYPQNTQAFVIDRNRLDQVDTVAYQAFEQQYGEAYQQFKDHFDDIPDQDNHPEYQAGIQAFRNQYQQLADDTFNEALINDGIQVDNNRPHQPFTAEQVYVERFPDSGLHVSRGIPVSIAQDPDHPIDSDLRKMIDVELHNLASHVSRSLHQFGNGFEVTTRESRVGGANNALQDFLGNNGPLSNFFHLIKDNFPSTES